VSAGSLQVVCIEGSYVTDDVCASTDGGGAHDLIGAPTTREGCSAGSSPSQRSKMIARTATTRNMVKTIVLSRVSLHACKADDEGGAAELPKIIVVSQPFGVDLYQCIPIA
jgi:hypothetical protein